MNPFSFSATARLSATRCPRFFRPSAVHRAVLCMGLTAALHGVSSHAQSTAPALSLKEVTVTGNPLGASELIAPAASYAGAALLLRLQTTLGETLDNTPGVSSTYFGPNASRPIVRGLDGDRIRILNNSGALLDVSGLSFDHAVSADPITIERIEVLRGPGALQYGGNAVGGVVNVIDNRIPREAQFDAKGGVSGKLSLNFATGNSERGTGVLVESGGESFTLHVDAFDRKTSDVRVPVELLCTKGGANRFSQRICNSSSATRGGAVGGTVFFDQGYLGASLSSYRSTYGTVAEDEVTIGMKSERVALEGERRNLGGFIQSVKGQLSHTDYSHTEFDGPDVGTVFKNKGTDLRLEARHASTAGFTGLIGLQSDNNNFAAAGTEAFAPYSKTTQNGVFAYEEYATSWGKLSVGGRLDSVKVQSLGSPDTARFSPASRDFKPKSFALGGLWNSAPNWQLTSNFAYTERAPKDYELFAQGPHIATRAWENGDVTLAKEKSTSLDVGTHWKSAGHMFTANAYVHQFKNYIGLTSTGEAYGQALGNRNPADANGDGIDDNDADNAILPEFAYQAVRARFVGLEASGNIRLVEGASTLDLALRGDLVRAKDLTNSRDLPRIAPARIGATLNWAAGPLGTSLGFDRSAAQSRVSPGDRTTDAYTRWSAALTYRQNTEPARLLWYARLDNLTNQLAYSATSVLTTTAFAKAPLPGRSVKVGLQAAF